MLEEKRQQGISQQSEFQTPKDDIEFDWTDIVAFIIAIFQVLLPYIVFIFGGIIIVMIMFQLIFK
ncbi:hypothetical protein [Alkaliphilus transvaalensis]|uniref:hypothetical protein n=1 Tax=Alkaliphilus transvaalensis TaxID=114628 RepID=UPI00047D30D7|nr:hypothetical protein [Alkaliphilus transvaalensis]